MPLSHIIAKHKPTPCPCSSSSYSCAFHGFLITRGSLFHGLASMMAFVNLFTADSEFAMGPRTDDTACCPSCEFKALAYGNRS